MILINSAYSLDEAENSQKPIIRQNTTVEPWAFKVGVEGIIIDFSNWGNYFGMQYTFNELNSFVFGIGLDLNFSKYVQTQRIFDSIKMSASFDYQRKFGAWLVTPYIGAGLKYTFQYNNNNGVLETENRITLLGFLGAEFFFSELFSLYFEYKLSGLYYYEMSESSENSHNWEINATDFNIGFIIYFGE